MSDNFTAYATHAFHSHSSKLPMAYVSKSNNWRMQKQGDLNSPLQGNKRHKCRDVVAQGVDFDQYHEHVRMPFIWWYDCHLDSPHSCQLSSSMVHRSSSNNNKKTTWNEDSPPTCNKSNQQQGSHAWPVANSPVQPQLIELVDCRKRPQDHKSTPNELNDDEGFEQEIKEYSKNQVFQRTRETAQDHLAAEATKKRTEAACFTRQ